MKNDHDHKKTIDMETLKPKFAKETNDEFYKQMRREVRNKVLSRPDIQRKNSIKAVVLLLCYVGAYIGILTLGNYTGLLALFYLLMGFSMIIVFVNSIHDAAHHSAFKNNSYNSLYAWTLELFGGNSYIWVKRHNLLHHPYANIQDWDIDIKQSDMVRIFPNSKYLPLHRYQHVYMFLLYPFYTLNWIFVRDFKDFFADEDSILKRVIQIPKIEYAKLFFFKIFNLFYMLVVPYMVLQQSFATIFICWLLMHLSASLLGVVALVSTHADEHAHFPEVPKDGKLSISWVRHQLDVTKDFSADSRLATFMYGGFTHHVAHHLFPWVPHSYLPHITPIIRRYARKYNLPYKSYPVGEAIRSHFRLLKNNGLEENIFRTGEL